MVSKLAKRGMPVDDLERAQRWRRRNLDPGRLKENRTPGAMPPPVPLHHAQALALASTTHEADPLQRVDAAFEAASWALGGPSFDEAAALLRQAMRQVPAGLRHHVLLDPAVMDRLVAHVLPVTHAADAALVAAGTLPPPETRPPMSDDDAHEMGAFWYAVACGELVLADA
jgi:hypothetical protein